MDRQIAADKKCAAGGRGRVLCFHNDWMLHAAEGLAVILGTAGNHAVAGCVSWRQSKENDP
jgi:hypothetical protein